jgi:CheY-like chemotaxis protein
MKDVSLDVYTILLVDDDALDRAAVRRLAAGPLAPHRIVEAASCAEARACLAEGRFDLALVDYKLGDGDGTELAPLLTARDIPTIFVTGAGSELVAVQALRLGVRDYVVKDVQSTHLLLLPSLVEGVVARHRAERERDRLYAALREAQALIQRLHGLLPICSRCKSIRNDEGYWQGLEEYLTQHSGIELTHGICPTCLQHYLDDMESRGGA